jgi:hypothetical protein
VVAQPVASRVVLSCIELVSVTFEFIMVIPCTNGRYKRAMEATWSGFYQGLSANCLLSRCELPLVSSFNDALSTSYFI